MMGKETTTGTRRTRTTSKRTKTNKKGTIEVGGKIYSVDERNKLVAERAYSYAEQRGFGGSDWDREQDWYRAEKEIDELLSNS